MTTTPESSPPRLLTGLNNLTLLDTPKSLDSSLINGENTLRKLGAGELVYDYELKKKGCILPFSFIFESDINLFEYKTHIDEAINTWKRIHPFLCCKILVKPDQINSFSRNRYFSLASKEKIESIDNVRYLKLVDSLDESLWMCLHERELNIDPVDCENGLLWRLSIIQFGEKKYCLLLTMHHAIVDGRNGFAILDQLLSLIEKSIKNEDLSFNLETFKFNPSIEEKLFNNDEQKLNNLNPNPKYEISPENKIPKSFESIGLINSDKRKLTDGKFVYLFENSNSNETLFVKDLLNARDSEYVSKFTSFSIDQANLSNLLKECKLKNAKLTGCLNLITALATYDLYKHFGNQDLAQNISYHFLANLRPFLDIGNLNMGYWPVVLNGIFNTEKVSEFDENFLREEFWHLAKYESDLIHERIKQNELIENAKVDTLLLQLIDEGTKFENGSVHFALSNLGSLTSSKSTLFNVKELYYNTSCMPNRWTSVVFHGLSSINNTLCWSLCYNSALVNDQVIGFLIDSIKKILKNLTNNSTNFSRSCKL